MDGLFFRRRRLMLGAKMLIISMATVLVGTSVRADVIHGESQGYSVDIDLDVTIATTSVNQAALSSGSGGSPYNGSAFAANFTSTGAIVIQTEYIQSSATSDVDGLPGSRTVTGSGGVFFIDAATVFDIVTASAEAIIGEATVTGDFGSFTRTGVTTLTNLAINVNGTDLVIPTNPAPNTVLFDFAGLTILLNEQFISGDGIHDAGITVNAIHVFVDNVAGFANGELIFGHGSAYAQGVGVVVPEPASCGLLLLGVAGVVMARRRHQDQERKSRT